jgi:transcriptional regulator of arginine metabolism
MLRGMANMKSERHARILQIIQKHGVETQEELAERLNGMGINVTQATVSRDIKELRLIKTPSGDGRYIYALPHDKSVIDIAKRAERIFRDSVISLDYSENLILIKTLTGNAHAVAAIVDEMNWEGIIGTIAGDDTFMVIVRPKELVPSLLERFNKLRRSREQP